MPQGSRSGAVSRRFTSRAAGLLPSSLGVPDLGISTMDDVVTDVRRITDITNLPVLVDIDTGWGGAFNIARAIKSMIKAGAAAVHIEDQVQAKRCGHRPGKAIVSREEWLTASRPRSTRRLILNSLSCGPAGSTPDGSELAAREALRSALRCGAHGALLRLREAAGRVHRNPRGPHGRPERVPGAGSTAVQPGVGVRRAQPRGEANDPARVRCTGTSGAAAAPW